MRHAVMTSSGSRAAAVGCISARCTSFRPGDMKFTLISRELVPKPQPVRHRACLRRHTTTAWGGAVTAPAAAAVVPAVTTVVSGTGSLLIGVGVCILAAAFSALVFFTIPTLLAWRRTAIALEALARTVDAEVPDTAASMRLSGLEVTDAIEELSLLGADLSRGVRTSAASIAAAEAGLRGGVTAAKHAMTGQLLPAVRSQVPAVRGALEGTLQQRARMTHTGPAIASAASATKAAANQARMALSTADLVGKAAALTALLQQRAGGSGSSSERVPEAVASMEAGA